MEKKNKLSKGNITKAILECIGGVALGVSDAFVVYLEAGYGASLSKMQYLQRIRENKRERRKILRETQKQEWRRYQAMLRYLEKEGFLRKNVKGDSLEITTKGKEKVEYLLKNNPLPGRSKYDGKSQKNYTIVIFDIPESMRRKRDWLREALKNLGFKMVQKSVWIGKVMIPMEFLGDLYELHLAKYVDIFEATKLGSLNIAVARDISGEQK